MRETTLQVLKKIGEEMTIEDLSSRIKREDSNSKTSKIMIMSIHMDKDSYMMVLKSLS
jgi:hypothetical protein